ncbi:MULTISPECIES: lysylphosphatidylglycerol synthase transmembrane domain-containing protein [Thermomonosporaceae]|uniref:lysylphosphatidylglycerol synthase transmembrane domain-containing protein n=1 Tax=Thermomonosporaceae TaxID=2012 RepID=UPI00255B3271|nr:MULTISPECIES: lysylphosphatidylglycerol synthase transmembrane domain-containing protein [Thermomonosporaceae]MDL4771503.1 lysylphosphatidylglycerol synthase transmembrane domain-containing protein [Actinomadura xylanilytica]
MNGARTVPSPALAPPPPSLDVPDIPGISAHSSAADIAQGDTPRGAWWRRRRGLIVQWGMLLAAVAALPLFHDQLPDPGALWSAATHAEPLWLIMVVLGEALSMASFARLQRRLLRIGGLRIPVRRAFAITYASNALSTTLPAGPAVSVVYTFRQFRRSGASAQLATAVILAGGVITTTAYTVVGLLALVAEPHARGPALLALAVPFALVLLLVPALRWAPARALLAAPLRRVWRTAMAHRRVAPYAERLHEGLALLRPNRRDLGMLVMLALFNWVFDILALLAAARAVGIDVDPHGVALAYFAAQAAGSLLPLLPGGIGAIESSMAAALVAFGATLTPAAAAVGLYRLVSYWVVVAVGWIAWAGLHEGPRLSAGTKRRLAGAGRALLDGFGAAACLTPYSTFPAGTPAEAPRN